MACIAWIEDDHERIGALVRLLEINRHTIKRYKSWMEVNENLDAITSCDAIILDIILPPADNDPYLGLSILEQLRNVQEYGGPVVVCSRVKNQVVLRQIEELGVAEILRKPVRPSVLHDVVTKALEED